MNNPSLEYINNRMSLRKPQIESLQVLDKVADILISDESNDNKLRKIKMLFPSLENFDREFPSLCFSLATGVGKTRLMGAFITYLYITKNIKNFILIAPNITIYNKLIQDFSNTGSEKYVFKGLKEFVQNQPKIVTGDNYKDQGKLALFESDITINIFNIDKINKDEQSIKSLSEWLGQSYYDYLCELENLVILMDESHHYRADKGMKVLNELNPLFGLELTATPQIEKGNKTLKFNNIIYDYPLFKAIIDGYVKEPSVATKKNFNPDNFSEEQIDKIKLDDGLAIHENTKVKLEEYSKNNNAKLVKPFTMVVCKNIEHANFIIDYIKSNDFFGGYYKDKVMLMTSKDGKVEKDDNIQKLLLLEHPLNKIEIVVHVNMLKEGWDVSNLYTIIPLRRSASSTLTEQTMGRGLRLPYGKRTGNDDVDRLTIVSHDKYQEIIEEANKETSILKASNIHYVEEMDLNKKEVVNSELSWNEIYNSKIDKESDYNLKTELIVEKEIASSLSKSRDISKEYFDNKSVKDEIISNIVSTTNKENNEIEKIYNNIIETKINDLIQCEKLNRINIPYLSVNKQTTIEQVYSDFVLDLSKFNFKPLNNDILIKHLGDGESFSITLNNSKYEYSNPKEILFDRINELPNIEYDKCSNIINSKIDEYIEYLNKEYDKTSVLNIIYNYSYYIVKELSKQLLSNMTITNNIKEENVIQENSPILSQNFTKYVKDDILDYRTTVKKNDIKTKIFNGFKKSCHSLYKFDSNSEKELSEILENSSCVIKWLRPADNQFNIYWNGINKYEPDFVVETTNTIYMVEVKKEDDMDDEIVNMKKEKAEEYCRLLNEYRKSHNIKEWKYIIIPHTDIRLSYDFDRYM